MVVQEPFVGRRVRAPASAGHLPHPLRCALDRGARARHCGRAKRRDAASGHRRRFRALRDRRPRRGHHRNGRRACSRCASRSPRRPSARDPGQLINMLFGNTSLHEDVVLHDVALPRELVEVFGGPRHGLARAAAAGRRAGAGADLLGAQAAGPAAGSARRACRAFCARRHRLHQGRPRARRPGLFPVRARASKRSTAALRAVAQPGGRAARYVPSLSGDLDTMRAQIALARDAGVDTVMVAPMIAGLSNFHRLVRENPAIAFLAHPTMAGAARIAPALLLGRLFRMLGADAVVFPELWRTLRLLPRYVPRARARGAWTAGRAAPLRPGAGRRHDHRSRARNA